MSPSDFPGHLGSILYYSESPEASERSPIALFHKPVTGQELVFAVSYSKPALTQNFKKSALVLDPLQAL